MKILNWVWGLVKLAKTLILTALLLASIALNLAFFTGGMIYDIASDVYETLTDKPSLARQHASTRADLKKERKANNKLRKEIANPNKRIVTYKGKKMALSQAVESTSGSIARRSAIAATRSVASMGGEALPVIGTSVIVAATGFELYDLCNTVKDMNDLKVAFDPSLKTEPEQTTICAMEVPTKEELWESTKASPGAAWNAAKTYTPTLEDIKNYEFPDVDWTGMWAASKDTAGWLKDETVDTSKDAWAATTEGAGSLWGNISEGVGNLWSSEEDGDSNSITEE